MSSIESELEELRGVVPKTHLTYRQLAALYMWTKIGLGKFKVNKSKVKFLNKIVSLGSFYRVLRQGRENVARAINTIFLLNACGLISDEELRGLVERFLSMPRDLRVNALESLIVM